MQSVSISLHFAGAPMLTISDLELDRFVVKIHEVDEASYTAPIFLFIKNKHRAAYERAVAAFNEALAIDMLEMELVP